MVLSQLQVLLESSDPLQINFTKAYPQYEAQLERMANAGIVMVPKLDRPLGDVSRASNRTPEEESAVALQDIETMNNLAFVIKAGELAYVTEQLLDSINKMT